jgi:hypothetical protein
MSGADEIPDKAASAIEREAFPTDVMCFTSAEASAA